MTRLKFEMWKSERKPGEFERFITRFTDDKGFATESWWSSPPDNIDHVGQEYLESPHRHPNAITKRHRDFIKKRFKEEMATINKSTNL